jgi:hypothetical protein
MRQLFQHLDSGETALVDVPAPQVRAGTVLIRTQATVVSAGTERMLVDFGRPTRCRTRQQPEKVRQVLDKARTDGIGATVTAVRNQLGQPLPLGYSTPVWSRLAFRTSRSGFGPPPFDAAESRDSCWSWVLSSRS